MREYLNAGYRDSRNLVNLTQNDAPVRYLIDYKNKITNKIDIPT